MHISCHVLTTIYFPKLLAGLRESEGPKRKIRIIPQFVSVFHQDISARKIKMTFQPVVGDTLAAFATTNLNCFTIGSKKQNSPSTRHGGAWGERRYSSYSFLISVLDGGEWSASRPGRALPLGTDPGIHRTGGWVGLRAGLNREVREKNPLPLPGIEPRSPGSPVPGQTLY
jgi:hypothetical protein